MKSHYVKAGPTYDPAAIALQARHSTLGEKVLRKPTNIVEIRLAHLRATSALDKGWYHVAVQNYLLCLEAVQDGGDQQAADFFCGRLAHCYRLMGLEHKAHQYQSLA